MRLGVIGIGSIGKNHVRVCSEANTCKLVGVSDIDKRAVNEIADRFDVKPFYNYKNLISKVDAAIIATPTSTHYDIAMDFLKEGKHLLVEKPLCDNVEKAKSLVEKAEEEDLVLAVGHIERHNPVVRSVKKSLEKGKFGKLITLTSKRVGTFPGQIHDVGVILDLGIHDIDIMRYLVGEVESVYSKSGGFKQDINFEDHANIILNFENGLSGVVEVNWLTPIKIRKLFLTCSDYFVEADYVNQTITKSSSSLGKVDESYLYYLPIKSNIQQISLEKREPLKNEIEDFIDAIINSREPLTTGMDGMIALKIATAAVLSSKEEREIKIEEIE
jgi:UDP-N-acetylglucosamine 3-dehydrogenase